MIDFPRLRASLLVAVSVACVSLSSTANAQNSGAWVEISGYRPSIHTTVNVTPNDQLSPPRSISFEDDLALADSETLPAINAGVWLSKSWNLQFDYYNVSRRSNYVIDREIEFDGAIFPVNGTIESRFTSDVYRVTLGRRIFESDTLRAGVELGVHLTNFKMGLSGEAVIDGGMVEVAAKNRTLLAPLPTLGLNVEFDVSDRITIGANTDYFRLKTSKFKGEMLAVEARAGYAITDKLQAGVLYRLVDYQYRFKKSDVSGSVDYRFSGPGLFLRLEL